MMECINLRERFGKRYRIGFDPCYDAKHRPRECLDPWMMVIRCRVGAIYPHGGTTLAVEVEGHRHIKAKLNRLDCCTSKQDGDHFGSFTFDVEDFATVARLVKPYRRRQVSEAERKRLAEIGYQKRQPAGDSCTIATT